MLNNAKLGMTVQSMICQVFNLSPNSYASNQFNSNYEKKYEKQLSKLIDQIFVELKLIPVECTSFMQSPNKNETWVPYNFILNNNSTLSIRTNKTGDKVSPRVVGQAGYQTLSLHFSELLGRDIKNQQDIKELIYYHIHTILPSFINYLLYADYTIWIYYEKDKFKYNIISSEYNLNIDLQRKNFTFTRNLEEWNESTTLKYNGLSIAEIQVHKKRSFKFRFIMKNLFRFIQENNENNETFGITAEKTICDLFNLSYPDSFLKRSSRILQVNLIPTIEEAFRYLPKPIMHTGSEPGSRSNFSKCPYDFVLKGNKTLSVKTNIGKYVCPPEVGQPCDTTFYYHFSHLIEAEYVDELIFKNLVLTKVHLLIPIYIKHLFDSDYLLRIYRNINFEFDIIEKGFAKNFIWEKSNFSFTNPNIEDWNESNTVKYNNLTLGNFQVHRNRNCFKFRFHFDNLIKIIKSHR